MTDLHPHITLRRLVMGGLVAAAALAPAASAAYTPGFPGSVGTAVQYEAHESTYDAVDGPSAGDTSWTDADTVKSETGSVSGHSAGWPITASPFPPPMTACTGGCAEAEAVAAGAADVAAGTLKSYAGSHGWGWGGHEALGTARSRVNLDDTITVSKSTTVVLRGRVIADLARRTSDFDSGIQQPSSRLEVSARFGYCGSEGCDPSMGYADVFSPDLTSSQATGNLEIDQPFEVEVELPAGESPFAAELDAQTNTVGELNGGTSARADAHEDGSDADRVEFEIVVPDDVVVTSGSGKLPIVGGKQEEQDTTAPALQVPAGITTDATRPNGATVAYSVQATDASGEPTVSCTPASGSTFAVGQTTVTCVATDAAGNATTKSFVVTVRGVTDQLAALRARILQLPKAAQAHLLSHLKPKCNSMASLRHALDGLVRKGELSQVTASELLIQVNRIGGALGC